MSDDRVFCRPCTCEWCRRNYTDKFCSVCCFESGNAFIDELNANYFDDLSNSSNHPPQHQTHSFESYNDNPHYGYPPQEPFVYNQNSCYKQNFVDNSQSPPQPQYETYAYELCGNDAHYGYDFSEKYRIAIAPVLLTEDPDNSLSMGDEHLSTILETESDEEFVDELVHIDPLPPGIDETDYDPKVDIRFIEQLLYDDTSSEDDSFEDIDFVEASPPDFELVSLEEVQDVILRAKLLNIHLLIDKIESLNNNPTLDYVLKYPFSSFFSYSDNSLPEFETFSDHTKETSSGSTTTYADNSPPEYDSFLFEIEPDQGELSSVAMEAILEESRVYVSNVLPTHPTLY
nr:hypothetical protein [Tanacetum cinerariifolium]